MEPMEPHDLVKADDAIAAITRGVHQMAMHLVSPSLVQDVTTEQWRAIAMAGIDAYARLIDQEAAKQ